MILAAALLVPATVTADTLSMRGFSEVTGSGFPQTAPNDSVRAIAEALFEWNVAVTKGDWRFDGSVQARWDTHQMTERQFDVAYWDRTIQRAPIVVRTLSASWARGPVSVDVGKQFIRWGKADILAPTDHFAPRDYLEIVDADVLAVTAGRLRLSNSSDSLDLVFAPRMTPSRTPLLDQRWAVVPAAAQGLPLEDGGAEYPKSSEYGARWNHTGRRLEHSISFFHGINDLPLLTPTVLAAPFRIEVRRQYPQLTAIGADTALPLPWFTIKAEANWFGSQTQNADEYVLYVAQLERQAGEWLLIGGYAGEHLSRSGGAFQFAPDRGLARAFLGRASLTVDANRSLNFEAVVRQNGQGVYGKFEYSQASGQHWRTTLTFHVFGGSETDFLGQYRRNSFGALKLRYSF